MSAGSALGLTSIINLQVALVACDHCPQEDNDDKDCTTSDKKTRMGDSTDNPNDEEMKNVNDGDVDQLPYYISEPSRTCLTMHCQIKIWGRPLRQVWYTTKCTKRRMHSSH